MEISLKALILALLYVQTLSTGVIYLNPGCSNFDSEGGCIDCSSRFYKDSQGICQPVNPNCNDYHPLNGDCVTCYSGFALIEEACLPEFLVSNMFDPYCNKFEGSKCVNCSSGYYFDDHRKCVQADPNCKIVEKNKCLDCYPGFELKGNKCLIQVNPQKDPHCNKFKNGKCVKCSYGFYFNDENICTKIPDECRNFRISDKKCV